MYLSVGSDATSGEIVPELSWILRTQKTQGWEVRTVEDLSGSLR